MEETIKLEFTCDNYADMLLEFYKIRGIISQAYQKGAIEVTLKCEVIPHQCNQEKSDHFIDSCIGYLQELKQNKGDNTKLHLASYCLDKLISIINEPTVKN
jgi:hypothetical protein